MNKAVVLIWLYCLLLPPPVLMMQQNMQAAGSGCPEFLSAGNMVGGSEVAVGRSVLRVVMPWKQGFQEFVSFNKSTCMLDGFSVQVFRHVLDNLGPRAPRIQITLHGNGTMTPSYNEMVDMVFNGTTDAIIADLTVTKERMEKVGYTHPYLPAKLVMVTPYRYVNERKQWDFLKPFSRELWVALLVCFASTGAVLCVLEDNNPDFGTHMARQEVNKQTTFNDLMESHETNMNSMACINPSCLRHIVNHTFHKRRLMNAYWFTSLCMFSAQQESIRTHLGRFVTVAWLLVMLIVFNSSYTASLASLISAQKRYPTVGGFQALLKNDNISVGYQEGSFMGNFLEKLGIKKHRLKSYTSTTDYKKHLLLGSDQGGVDAVIDELPFVHNLLLQSPCDLTTNSNDDALPTFGGFGFGLAKNSTWIDVISKEILILTEDRTIKQLQKKWNVGGDLNTDDCNSTHLHLQNFVGLFEILACVYLVCMIWRLLQIETMRRIAMNTVETNSKPTTSSNRELDRHPNIVNADIELECTP